MLLPGCFFMKEITSVQNLSVPLGVGHGASTFMSTQPHPFLVAGLCGLNVIASWNLIRISRVPVASVVREVIHDLAPGG